MEISLVEVINAIAVERLRTQGCFNLRVAVIRLTPEIYTERHKEQHRITLLWQNAHSKLQMDRYCGHLENKYFISILSLQAFQ